MRGDTLQFGLQFLLGGKIALVFRGEDIGIFWEGEFDESVIFPVAEGEALVSRVTYLCCFRVMGGSLLFMLDSSTVSLCSPFHKNNKI